MALMVLVALGRGTRTELRAGLLAGVVFLCGLIVFSMRLVWGTLALLDV